MSSSKTHKQWHMVLGRFQVSEPHIGHRMLIDTLLAEGKNVLVVLRKEDGTKKNPLRLWERIEAFEKIYEKEIFEGRMIVEPFYDVVSVNYGRDVGYDIREMRFDKDIEDVSGTKIRNET